MYKVLPLGCWALKYIQQKKMLIVILSKKKATASWDSEHSGWASQDLHTPGCHEIRIKFQLKYSVKLDLL